MTPSEVADKIGITTQQVRWLIREGRIKAKRTPVRVKRGVRKGTIYQHEYDVAPEEVSRFRDSRNGPGRPKGVKNGEHLQGER